MTISDALFAFVRRARQSRTQLVEDSIPQPRRTLGRIARHWRGRKLLYKNHGRVQGFLILLARFQRPGSRRAAFFFGAADWYWWRFHYMKRWGSGY